MDVFLSIKWWLFFICLTGIFLVFFGYPLILLCRCLYGSIAPGKTAIPLDGLPRVSIITVSHKSTELLDQKIQNLQQLDYPGDLIEFVLFLDGTDDEEIEDIQAKLPGIRVRQDASEKHQGKAYGLNEAVRQSRGDILVFSDIDAFIEEKALRSLVQHFQDSGVGGVCGQRTIWKDNAVLRSAQSRYLAFDNLIKRLEAKVGSITSNEGKLYAMRRELFTPLDPAATDDLYNCLSVVESGYRFVYEPGALMYIRSPSRSGRHEIDRRRRIVTRSLHGIARHRGVLNPLKFGWYAVGLFINKILRRWLPIFLIGLLLSTAALCSQSSIILVLFLGQIVFYGSALFYPVFNRYATLGKLNTLIRNSMSLTAYFVLGNFGTLLGLKDFLSGKRIEKWTPVKR